MGIAEKITEFHLTSTIVPNARVRQEGPDNSTERSPECSQACPPKTGLLPHPVETLTPLADRHSLLSHTILFSVLSQVLSNSVPRLGSRLHEIPTHGQLLKASGQVSSDPWPQRVGSGWSRSQSEENWHPQWPVPATSPAPWTTSLSSTAAIWV